METIFYPVPLTDVLEFKQLQHSNDPYRFQQVGHRLEGPAESNLVLRVYEQLRAEFDLPSLDIYLNKRIPSGAGLGGGSSDAAFMMRMLNTEFQLGLSDKQMEERVAAFGADCAFFIQGNELSLIDFTLKGWTLVLVKPQEAVSTKAAYASICPRPADKFLPDSVQHPVEEWKDLIKNDFEATVFPQFPKIAAIKETLYDMGAVYAAMSGSGSCVFGLFRRKQEVVRKVFSDCFVYQSLIRQ